MINLRVLQGLAIAWQVKSNLDYSDSGHKHHIAVLKRGEVWGQVLCPCPMPYALCPMPYALCPREHLMLLRKAISHSPNRRKNEFLGEIKAERITNE